ncbi:MAG TPA: HAD hydrolase-like protein, partial [bacterium]|nr:HAD hydrolase-like protein [bacterium]
MVKAVLFDLDDTLILEEKATEEAFLAAASLAYRRYGLSPEKLLKTIQGLAEDFWKTAPAYRWCQQVGISPREALWADFADEIPEARIMQSWIPDFRRRCWQEALRKSGIEDLSLAEEMATCYRKECRQRHRLFPEVRPVLKRLSSWPLAMVTNGLRRHQCEKINQAGLARFFSVV